MCKLQYSEESKLSLIIITATFKRICKNQYQSKLYIFYFPFSKIVLKILGRGKYLL